MARSSVFRDPASDTRMRHSSIQDEEFFSAESEESEEENFWFLVDEQTAHARLRRRAGQFKSIKLGRRK